MTASVQQFWQLIVRSGLHDEAACRQFADAYFKSRDAGTQTASLPEWLVANKALTRYQAKILINGRPGPFVFGEYVVAERIDAGQLAGQFQAIHRGTGCPVSLRFLSGPAAADAALLASLGEQTKVAAALSRDTTRLAHAYTLIDSGQYKFFVLEALAGQSLAERFAKSAEAIAPQVAMRIAAQAAAGLAPLHRAGRAHGEIGPASIWLDGSGAKLLGFPWSPDPLASPKSGASGGEATTSADVYVLSCVVYQLLTGKALTAQDGAAGIQATLQAIAGVTPELAALVARMLDANQAERIGDATQLFAELGQHGAGANATGDAPPAARVALDASIDLVGRRSTASMAAPTVAVTRQKPAAAPQSKSAAATASAGAAAASAARTVAENESSSVENQLAVAPQPAGIASLSGLVDPDEPTTPVRARKPAPATTTTDKKHRLPLIVTAASAAVVLIAAVILVISRGFGGGTKTNVAQTPGPKPATAPASANESAKSADPFADTPDPVDGASPDPADMSASTTGAENPNNGDAKGIDPSGGEPAAGKTKQVTPPASGRAAEQLVGVGGTMWESPTAGKPLELAYIPPGAEVILALRPADLARTPEAERLLDPRTTGALGTWISEQLPALAGAPLDGIEQAIVALLPVADGPPQWSLVAHLKEAPAEDELLKKWGNPQAKEKDGAKYFQKEDTAYYIPAAGAGRTIVIAPAALLVEDILPNGANPPALRREMEIVLGASDADRMVTLLAAPNILLTGGEAWLPGAAARARSPLDWFLAGESADRARPAPPMGKAPPRAATADLSSVGLPKAVLASAHLTERDLFFEVRLLADPNQPPAKLAEAYRERVARLPRRTSDYLRTLALGDYSRDVLIEFPLMVEQLAHFTVAGTDGRQVVLRTYLPAAAAHNLALGGHLAMLESPRTAGAPASNQTAGGTPKAGPTTPQPDGPPPDQPATNETVAQRLEHKMSLNFDRNTLEPTLKQIGQEIGVEVVIMGADLQNDGITRNKAIDKFAERDLPAREILLKIMSKANPDGKLIYVIKPGADGTGEALHFTTRAAAAARGDKLPAEFEKAETEKPK